MSATAAQSASTSEQSSAQSQSQAQWLIEAKTHLLDRSKRAELFSLLIQHLKADTRGTFLSIDSAIQSDTGDALAFVLRGLCLYIIRQSEQALVDFDLALEVLTNGSPISAAEAEGSPSSVDASKPSLAQQLPEKMLRELQYYIHLLKYEISYSLQDYSEAMASATAMVQLEPQMHGCWYQKSIVEAKLGMVDESLSSIDTAIEKLKSTPVENQYMSQYLTAKADLAFLAVRLDKAETSFSQIIDDAEKRENALDATEESRDLALDEKMVSLYKRGEVRLLQKNYANAARDFSDVISTAQRVKAARIAKLPEESWISRSESVQELYKLHQSGMEHIYCSRAKANLYQFNLFGAVRDNCMCWLARALSRKFK